MFIAKFFLFIVLTIMLSFLDNIMVLSGANDTFRIALELTISVSLGLILALLSIWSRNAMVGKYYKSKPEDSAPASAEQLAAIDNGFKSIGRFYDSSVKLTSAQANEILAEIKRQQQRGI